MDNGALPFEGFFIRDSLWKVLKNQYGSTIKQEIGDSLVDDTIQLHSELFTLHEIWISNEIFNVYTWKPESVYQSSKIYLLNYLLYLLKLRFKIVYSVTKYQFRLESKSSKRYEKVRKTP